MTMKDILLANIMLLIMIDFTTSIPYKYYMDQNCIRTLTISSPSIRLKLTRYSKYRSNMDCTLTLKASSMSANETTRLMVVFRKIDIATELFSCNDYVSLKDGSTGSAKGVSGLKSRMCGENEPRGAYYTTSEYLTVVFHSNFFDNDDGFDLLITPFHSGACSSSETKCRYGQCIDRTNRCDGYDHCGDYSDESCSNLTRVGAGVIVGVIIVILAIVAVVIVAVCCIRKRGGLGGIIKGRSHGNTSHQAQNIPLNQQTYPAAQPAYPQAGYAPPPQGYAPPPQGYAPPPQGYAPPPQDYAPPTQPGYPPAQPPPYQPANNPYPYGQPQ